MLLFIANRGDHLAGGNVIGRTIVDIIVGDNCGDFRLRGTGLLGGGIWDDGLFFGKRGLVVDWRRLLGSTGLLDGGICCDDRLFWDERGLLVDRRRLLGSTGLLRWGICDNGRLV